MSTTEREALEEALLAWRYEVCLRRWHRANERMYFDGIRGSMKITIRHWGVVHGFPFWMRNLAGQQWLVTEAMCS